MTRLAACLALLALAASAQAQDPRGDHDADNHSGQPGGGYGQRGGYANPSAAIAAEMTFARAAREKGQWTAAKATAALDAIMFAPALVEAQVWLKSRPNPPVSATWQPYQVWASCDGSVMVTNGAWQRGDAHGWFTSVWQRQDKGDYKWVFDHGAPTAAPLEAPDMIVAKVADCPDRRGGDHLSGGAGGRHGKPVKHERAPLIPFNPAGQQRRSSDGTLTWEVTADANGTHDFSARMIIDGRMQEFRKEHVAAGG